MSSALTTLAAPAPLADANGNNDSGYSPSQLDMTAPESPRKVRSQTKKNGATYVTELK